MFHCFYQVARCFCFVLSCVLTGQCSPGATITSNWISLLVCGQWMQSKSKNYLHKYKSFHKGCPKIHMSHQREMEYLLPNISFAQFCRYPIPKEKVVSAVGQLGTFHQKQEKNAAQVKCKTYNMFHCVWFDLSFFVSNSFLCLFLLSVGKETIPNRQILSVPCDWFHSEFSKYYVYQK